MTKQVKIAAEQLAIGDWVAGLAAIRERDFTLEAVQDYILQHAVRPDTLEKYLFFSHPPPNPVTQADSEPSRLARRTSAARSAR